MVSAWWLVLAAGVGFSLGFVLAAALTMVREDEREDAHDHPAPETTPQHT